MALATLSIDLVAQLASLQAGLDKAGRIAERSAAQIEARFSNLKSLAGGIGAGLAAGFSVAGIGAFVRATVDGVDSLNDLADATGASIENISALEDIAARTGTSIDTVGGALIKLNQTLANAKPGSEAANALKALGLNAEELKRLDPAEALRQTAVALSGFANDGNKARLVQELFGKSIREVAPLLNDLAAAGKLNATVTTEQAKAAEAFNLRLFQLQKNVTDGARAITADLLPALERYAVLVERVSKGRGLQAFGAELVSEVQSARLTLAVSAVEDLQTALAKDPGNNALSAALVRAREDADRLLKVATGANEKLKGLVGLDAARGTRPANEGGGGLRSRNPSLPSITATPAGPKAPSGIKNLEAAPLSQATLDALRAIESTDVAKIAQINAALDELFTIRASGVGGGADVDSAIEKLRDDLEKLSPEAQKAAESQQRLIAILAQTPTGQLSATIADIKLLNAAFADGKISAEQWAEAVRNATGAGNGEGEKQPFAELSEFAQQASRNIQDALGDSVVLVLDGKFGEIDDLFKNLLKSLVAQAIAAQIGEALFPKGVGGKGGGGLGDIIGSFLSSFGGARAAGGPVTAGVPYLVGERGPEILVPRSNGTVLPNGVGLGSRAGPTVVVNVNGPVPQETIAQIRAEVGRALSRYQRNVSLGAG